MPRAKGYGLRTGHPMDKRLFEIWRHMRQRCENPNNTNFRNYGGRGIEVCEEWHSFVMFASWAINNGYAENLTVERIDVNGNYGPSNCCWATMKEQAKNRRSGEHVRIGNHVKSYSVRVRSNGKWEYRIEGEPLNGKRRQVSKSGFATKEECMAAAEKRILEAHS